MKETKRHAIARAKRLGFPIRQVVRASSGGYYIAPRGVTGTGKRVYAALRAKGYSKARAAAIAHSK